MTGVLDRIRREPVYLGAAVLATFEAAWPSAPTGVKLAAGAWVAFGQRAFSTAKATAEERVEVARYVGAVEANPPANP